jgi:hypothetical protein
LGSEEEGQNMGTDKTLSEVREEHLVIPFTGTDDTARLSFDNGLERLDLRADTQLGQLLEADFAEPYPVVWAAGQDVHLEYPLGSRLLRRMKHSRIRIGTAVTWSLDVHGGAAHLDADLRDIELRALSLHSGAAYARIRLGPPAGTCTIRLSSVKDLRLERPADVPVRVEIAKGATRIALDDRQFGAVGNGLADHTSGYEDTENRYLVIVSGGADGLTVAKESR